MLTGRVGGRGQGLRKDTEEDWSSQMAERTVEIGEAAKVLGISTEAVRKRIKRGSLKAQKNGGGQWLVILDEARFAAAARDNGGDGVQANAAGVATTMDLVRSSAAVEEALRDEVDVLRDEVTFLRDEVSRLETIIVSLTQNIKLLDAPRQTQPQPRMSWWLRLKSRFIGR
jgi:hypothetical protein